MEPELGRQALEVQGLGGRSLTAIPGRASLDRQAEWIYPARPFSGRPLAVLFAILTLFPEAIEPYTGASILGIAQDKGLATIRTVDFRDFTRDRHRTVDDRPYGGGPGMVLKPEPILDCIEWLESRHGAFHRVLLTPTGAPFTQKTAQRLAGEERVLLLCGRYEGFDDRIRDELEWEEISLGDFVLSGGEIPALAVVEATVRLIPGVLGDQLSNVEESFRDEGLLDHPHYTRPRLWRGRPVPEVLLGGDHAAIARWRAARALERTQRARPDLLGYPRTTDTPPQRRRSGAARFRITP
jgi:tRNA (guanine37-N1)-methyltransferase